MGKRIKALLLAACLSLSLTVSARAAGTTIAVTPSADAPSVGETFTVDVSIAGNPGVSAIQFTLTFDSDVLDCLSADTGPVLRGALAATNPDAKAGAIVAAAAVSPMEQDGVLASFTFKVVGEGDASIGFADYVVADEGGTDIPFTLEGVEEVEPPEPEKPEKPKPPVEPDEPDEEEPDEEEPEEKPEKPTKPEKPEDPGETEDPEAPVYPYDPEAPVYPEAPVRHLFTDTTNHWAERYINTAVELGLFQGYADGSFKPAGNVSRGAYVTVLWRLAGKPAPETKAPFADTAGAWCEDAVSWAYENGYVNGKTAQRFAPGDPVNRQEAMKMLFLFHGGKSGQEVMFTKIYDDTYTDSGTMSSWAKAPMYWAVYNELISGTSQTTLGPRGLANRAQLAKILVNYTEKFGA